MAFCDVPYSTISLESFRDQPHASDEEISEAKRLFPEADVGSVRAVDHRLEHDVVAAEWLGVIAEHVQLIEAVAPVRQNAEQAGTGQI